MPRIVGAHGSLRQAQGKLAHHERSIYRQLERNSVSVGVTVFWDQLHLKLSHHRLELLRGRIGVPANQVFVRQQEPYIGLVAVGVDIFLQVAKLLGAGRVIGAGRQIERLKTSGVDEVVSLVGDPDAIRKAIAEKEPAGRKIGRQIEHRIVRIL